MAKQRNHDLGKHAFREHFRKQFTRLLISSGFAIGSFGAIGALATEAFPEFSSESHGGQARSLSSAESSAQSPLADGVYLYGETQQPDQVGATYMVMEVVDNQVVGALYMPYSSFDCFQGEFQGSQLDLTVVNSYDRTTHDYSLAVQSENYIASIDDPVIAPARLNGFYNLDQVSDNDQRILETCKADL